MTRKHSPLPWKAMIDMEPQWKVIHSDSEFCCVVLTSQGNDEANAQFIVTACNSHYEMREAMQEFVDRAEKGLVRSGYTYRKFKAILAKGNPDE